MLLKNLLTKSIIVSSYFVASGLLSGYVPKSPGTAGSFTCLIIWYLCHNFLIMHNITVILTVIILGLITSQICLYDQRQTAPTITDPQFIVIDEWAGMLIALHFIPSPSVFWLLISFALFRFFDITKLGPIGWSEKLPAALGIMADDILAGAAAAGMIYGLKNI